ALTGHVPFEAATVEDLVSAHVHTPLTPPNQVVLDITQTTNDALIRAMAKNPSERFQTYDEMILMLTAARSELLFSRYNQAAPETKKSWWNR
ncbi:MAG: serine/threonine protein kinase, partial [Verrucomicrobiota bacterium]